MSNVPPAPRNVIAQTIADKLKEWEEIKVKASVLSEQESILRLQIVELAFPQLKDNNDIKGTLTYKLPNGAEIKTEAKFNVKVDDEVLAASKEDLITVELVPIDLLFNYKPSLIQANYDKLTTEQKEKLSDIISFERAKANLKYVPPKPTEIQEPAPKPKKSKSTALAEDDKPF